MRTEQSDLSVFDCRKDSQYKKVKGLHKRKGVILPVKQTGSQGKF